MPYEEQLADRLRIALTEHDGISERKMFGGLCMMKRGNMLCGIMGQDFMFRVGADAMRTALEQSGARPVQFGDRQPMTGFVFVAAKATEGDAIDQWINWADAYNTTLPAK